MSASLKLISLNIEGDNHYPRLEKFFAKENANVYCLQEVFEVDIPFLEKLCGKLAVYAPFGKITAPNSVRLSPKGAWGVAIFTDLQVQHTHVEYYVKSNTPLPEFQEKNPNSFARAIARADLKVQEETVRILTTHFTWTPGGSVTEEQKHDLTQLIQVLKSEEPFILCGDFNAPRGKEIFDTLSSRYQDNIPEQVTTTIDPSLHRKKNLQLVVDGLFTSPDYSVHDVNVLSGVSDHQAIVATIFKR